MERTIRTVLILALLLGAGISGAAEEPKQTAHRAFEMRLAGDVDAAVELLQTALAEHPDSPALHHEMSCAQLYLMDFAASLAAAEAAVASAPDEAVHHEHLSLIASYSVIDAAHHQQKQRMRELGEQVLAELHRALELEPGRHEARYTLVQRLTEMAPDLGIEGEPCQQHLKILDEGDPVCAARARCCGVSEKEQRAIWKQLLAEQPQDARLLAEAARGLLQAGDIELGAECLEKALQIDPQRDYGLLNLGLAHFMKQDMQTAAELTRRYIDRDPPVPLKAYAMARLAQIHHRQGDNEAARVWSDKAEDLDPHVWHTFMPPPEEIFIEL